MTRLSMGLAMVALLSLCPGRPARVGAAASPAFVTLDPAFSRIVPDGAKIEKLARGFPYVEGPVWDRAGGFLFFSTEEWRQDLEVDPGWQSGGVPYSQL